MMMRQLGLTARTRPPVARRIAFLSPHPDDIELSAGLLIHRLVRAGHTVLAYYITDGAPSRSVLASLGRLPAGYHRARYRAIRRRESSAAARLLGILPKHTHFMHYCDLETHLAIPRLVRDLSVVLESADSVFTCPFEGGHPDHDITRFCLAVALRIAAASHDVFEYASYNHRGYHHFADREPRQYVVRADEAEFNRKRRVQQLFKSQRDEAQLFSARTERFRAAPLDAALETYATIRGQRFYEGFAYRETEIVPRIASYLATSGNGPSHAPRAGGD